MITHVIVYEAREDISHPFERRIVLIDSNPLRVGRAVNEPVNNVLSFIFDCKVLSRNHCRVWFDEGKFWIMDTNSSNGTFVNNKRLLSPNDKENCKYQLNDGDLVQFGVDVNETETSITRSVVGHVHFFLSFNYISGFGNNPNYIESIIKVTECLKTIKENETILDKKIDILENTLTNTEGLQESLHQNIVDESGYLSRISLLEQELDIFCENPSNPSTYTDSVKERLNQNVINEKNWMDLLNLRLEEKTQIKIALEESQVCLSDSMHEANVYMKKCEKNKIDLKSMEKEKEKMTEQLDKLEGQNMCLQKKLDYQTDQIEIQHKQYTDHIKELYNRECNLSKIIVKLQEDNNLRNSQTQKNINDSKNGSNWSTMSKDNEDVLENFGFLKQSEKSNESVEMDVSANINVANNSEISVSDPIKRFKLHNHIYSNSLSNIKETNMPNSINVYSEGSSAGVIDNMATVKADNDKNSTNESGDYQLYNIIQNSIISQTEDSKYYKEDSASQSPSYTSSLASNKTEIDSLNASKNTENNSPLAVKTEPENTNTLVNFSIVYE
ncbi:hypothetical protein A3Q56_01790 [Intoshia linei]|uniref:FHA domain-containing protein n=1 Tax=Intoshia linei TaxID=1819745 RepID=A0A177BA90_9BILA|nr:hypothetical protein A3Q56_01790 [Intoshia linei]